jgi:uncharacterized protein (TIGR02271 family)
MAQPSIETVRAWRGRIMVDADGAAIGTIADIYLDNETNEPTWAAVHIDFGDRDTLVPLAGAIAEGEQVRTPQLRGMVIAAPPCRPDRALRRDEERELYRHYSLDYTAVDQLGTTQRDAPERDEHESGIYDQEAVGRSDAGATTDEAMTRSEEQLQVGKQRRPRSRVRLQKYVATEHVPATIPVQREGVRLVEEPIVEGAEVRPSGPSSAEQEPELILHEEQPVIDKRVVPRERVRLAKETVTEDQQVTESVRKEQIELDEGELR